MKLPQTNKSLKCVVMIFHCLFCDLGSSDDGLLQVNFKICFQLLRFLKSLNFTPTVDILDK